jgi:competence protein ComEA
MKISKIINIVTLSASLLLSAIPAYAAPVNVNTASADEISQNLKGIGSSKANAVVSYRDKNGKFTDLDSLTLVKGIGSKTVEKNKTDIIF